MGCTTPKKHEQLERTESVVGVLRVTILGVQINDKQKRTQQSIKVRVSNQHFSTNNLPPVGTENVGGDCFTFVINSFYKAQGRVIEVGYFSANLLVSFGAVDANPIVEGKGAENFRLILNHPKLGMNGFVLLRAVFQVSPVYDMTFQFEEAISRRKTRTFGQDSVAVRLTIGEEVRQTEYQKDTPKESPVWKDTKYSFKVPHGVHKGLLELVSDRDEIVGSAELDIEDLVNAKEGDEQMQSQTLYFIEAQKQITAADIKYSFILGHHANFAPRAKLYSSAIRAIRSKKEGFSEFKPQQKTENLE